MKYKRIKCFLPLLLFIFGSVSSGCSHSNVISDETTTPTNSSLETSIPSPMINNATPIPTPISTPIPSASRIPTSVEISSVPDDSTNTVVTGTFRFANPNPYNYSEAVVEQAGTNLYHLNVYVMYGFSHNSGEIDFDFKATEGRLQPLDPEYEAVTLQFSEDSLVIDYPDNGAWGGINAEPKGTFYLDNSGQEESPFLTRVYDQLKINGEYRGVLTNVLTYEVKGGNNLLLVQTYSDAKHEQLQNEALAVHNKRTGEITSLGSTDSKSIKEQLVKLGVNEDTIYTLLHKRAADHLIEVEMAHFDNEGSRNLGDDYILNEEEAFYIVTGIEDATSVAKNSRDENNIGSIYITEVDHSDDDIVQIHVYEMVRNSDDDIHQATADWIEVNRKTGKIKTFFEE